MVAWGRRRMRPAPEERLAVPFIAFKQAHGGRQLAPLNGEVLKETLEVTVGQGLGPAVAFVSISCKGFGTVAHRDQQHGGTSGRVSVASATSSATSPAPVAERGSRSRLNHGAAMADLPTDRIGLARHHVATGRRIVAKQRRLIAEIRARGGDCEDADNLLGAFERTLAIFEDDLAVFMRDSGGRP